MTSPQRTQRSALSPIGPTAVSKMAALAAVLAISLSACDGGPDLSGKPDKGPAAEPKHTQLEDAYDNCDPSLDDPVELADGNHSILISGAQSEDYATVACILVELDTPEYITTEMDSTTAMMGRQSEEDNGITYEWTYHPDNGLDMVLHED